MRRKLKAIPVGEKFGRWTVAEKPFHAGGSVAKAICVCDCGTKKTVSLSNLVSGITNSCGCLNIEKIITRSTKHGHSRRGKRERLYSTWASMNQRCSDQKQVNFKDYGGRGISVCDEWKRYEPFLEWAMNSGYKKNLTIERVDHNGNYCPENCTWIPRSRQNRNRRDTRMLTAFGETKGIADWVDDPRCKTTLTNIRRRIGLGWSIEEAITSRKKNKWSRRGDNVRKKVT